MLESHAPAIVHGATLRSIGLNLSPRIRDDRGVLQPHTSGGPLASQPLSRDDFQRTRSRGLPLACRFPFDTDLREYRGPLRGCRSFSDALGAVGIATLGAACCKRWAYPRRRVHGRVVCSVGESAEGSGTSDQSEVSRSGPSKQAGTTGPRARLFAAKKGEGGLLHAVLGFACAGHALLRIGLLLGGVEEMGFRGDWTTLLCMCMHAALGLSAFSFRVPKRRGKHGTQIWQEYREHNAVFTLRALVAMLCAWVEDRYNVPRLWYVRVLAIYWQLFAADAVSRRHALPTTTLAGAPFPPALRLFLACFQMFAGANLLYGNGFWQQFCVVFAVQLTAFILTLNRRRLISPKAVVGLYTALLLVVNQLVMLEVMRTRDLTVMCCGFAVIVFRLGLKLNKYVSWSLLLVLSVVWDPSLLRIGDGGGPRAWTPLA